VSTKEDLKHTDDLLTPKLLALLDGRNYVHVATVMADGSPHTLPAWAMVENGEIVVGTGNTTDKAVNLRRDPRVSISVTDSANPNLIAHIRGRVVREVDADHGAIDIMHRIAHNYTGRDHPDAGPERVIFFIHPEHVLYAELTLFDA
jgi:PPOX class probable F420-dependent enzyme